MISKDIKSKKNNIGIQEDINSVVKLANSKINSKTRKVINKLKKKLFNEKQRKNNTHLLVYLYLNKNIETLSIAERLINDDYFDEAFCLMRMGLERAALIIKMLVDGLSINEIEKITGNRCISFLKRHFDIGGIYGLLSKFSHSKVMPVIHSYVISFYKTGRKNEHTEENSFNIYLKAMLFLLREINFAALSLLCKDYLPSESKWHVNEKGLLQISLPLLGNTKTVSEMLFNLCKITDQK